MRLQVSIWAQDLPAGQDPFAVLTLLDHEGTIVQLLGQTEVLQETQNPDWTKLFYLEQVSLTKATHVVVTLCNRRQLHDDGKPMTAVFDVSTVLGTKGGTVAKQLSNKKSVVYMHVEQATSSGLLHLQLEAPASVSCYFELQRSRPSSKNNSNNNHVWDAIFRSEPAPWPQYYLEVDALCSGRWDQPFRLVLFTQESNHQSTELGQAILSLRQLTTDMTSIEIRSSSSSNNSNNNNTILTVVQAQVTGAAAPPSEPDIAVNIHDDDSSDRREPTFANYVSGGCELRVIVAVDATASNGDPRQATSLHHFSSNGEAMNAYETVLQSLCPAVAKFDSDQKFPIWGFGAKPPPGKVVSHCFSMGSDDNEEEVAGLDGLLEAYRATFRSGLVMSSPRDFSQVIERASVNAQKQLDDGGQAYTILLLLTNGGPSDVDKTVQALTNSSTQKAPISVLLVGVGDGDFTGVRQVLSQYTDTCRDCVGLVESLDTALDDIPKQLETYFVAQGIYPQPEAMVEDIAVEPYNADGHGDLDVPLQIDPNTGKASLAETGVKKFKQFTKWLNTNSKKLMKQQREFRKHQRNFNRMQKQFKRMFK